MARPLPAILADLDRALAATDSATLLEKHVPALAAQRFMREALGRIAIDLALRGMERGADADRHVM